MDKYVSIVMTSYNYAQYIGEGIESVLNQTYPNWELIIADDGSSDNSVEIIQSYIQKDSRIKLYRHEGGINKGLAETIKLGISKAQYSWIAFLESDDKFSPDALKEKIEFINENPETDILFTDLEMFGNKNKIAEYEKYFKDIEEKFFQKDKSKQIKDFKKIIPRLNIIPTFSVVMLRKNILEECDFNSPCRASVDYYLWAQLCSNNFFYLNKKLSYWRIHSDSYINTDKHNWLTRFIFFYKIYCFTIKDKNIFLKALLILNYIRTRIIYIKFAENHLKINILNHKFILEKDFKKKS